MTLEQVLENRTPGQTMRAHNWYSYCWKDNDGTVVVNVIHHYTEMLQFKATHPDKPYFPVPVGHVQNVDLGNGSKSDQDGMNRIFRKLGLPWYYSRKGSAHIVQIEQNPELLPKYLQNRDVRVNHFGYSA